jgi:hypothetical protein
LRTSGPIPQHDLSIHHPYGKSKQIKITFSCVYDSHAYFPQMCASFYFTLVGLTAAHHHPDIFHEGDAIRGDRDWGLSQLDAVRDRPSINGAEGKLLPNDDGTKRVIIDE